MLTDPTTGGVTASYAMLGDIHIAEPGALICFAGPRVIQQTIREQLPEGFQRAEYLLAHGMIDMVVHRHKMRETLSRICLLLMRAPAVKHDTKKLNGNAHYANGSPVDAKLIDTRNGSGQTIEAEILAPEERFEATHRDKRPQRRRHAADDALASQRQTALMSATSPSRSPARSLIGGCATLAQPAGADRA